MRYWDTSALVKLYIPEASTPWYLSQLVTSTDPALTSEITEVELYSTLSRKERKRSIDPGAARLRFSRFQSLSTSGDIILVPFGQEVVKESRRIADLAYGLAKPILIRSLDLIHIASASVVHASTMVTADNRLRELASALNMKVLPEAQ